MMKKFNLYLLISILILLQSCLSMIVNKYELDSKKPKLEKINVPGKEVYFIGMAHLATKDFYDNTKLLVGDLQAKGFVFYVEAINDFTNKNKSIDTISLKKLRKILDTDLSIKYSQSDNPYFQKIQKKYNLIDQPKYDFFELTNFKRIDYNYTELVNFYEAKFNKLY